MIAVFTRGFGNRALTSTATTTTTTNCYHHEIFCSRKIEIVLTDWLQVGC